VVKAIVFDAYGTLFDVQSVMKATEIAFPGYGAYVAQIWRMKQLEYSWLRSLMGSYVNFEAITHDALEYALTTLGLKPSSFLLKELVQTFNELAPFEDTQPCLEALADYRLAILSNGSGSMIDSLVTHAGIRDFFNQILSVDEVGFYKPHKEAYRLASDKLGLNPSEILFVSSNGFDVAGAKQFGYQVARIQRVSREFLTRDLINASAINFGPSELYQAMRSQLENLGQLPDHTLCSLFDLPQLTKALALECVETSEPA